MKRFLKGAALVLGAGVLALVIVLGVNTWRYTPETVVVEQIATTTQIEVDTNGTAGRLAQAVQFRTDSSQPDNPDFSAFLEWLKTTYPAVHQTLDRRIMGDGTPLYLWAGSEAGARPVLLAAHYDVVPVTPDSLDRWTHPPFAGVVDAGFVWGRGTLDNKGALIAILDTVTALIDAGFQPKRDIYLSFGHDEEVGGNGARAVAEALKAENVQLEWILDEGSFVLDGIIPGLNRPVASINVAEKGIVTLKLTARGEGGHSSLPPRETAVGILAGAIYRLQQNPVPGGLTDVSAEFFNTLGREFALGQRIVFANAWLFRPLLENILSGAATTDAMLRTTTAPTMLQGSPQENVLATEATARVNFRIHPRDTVETIVAHVRETVADERIEITVPEQFSPASPVSSSAAGGYSAIRNAVLAGFGDVAPVAGLTIAATDARHYQAVADNAYRINPFLIGPDDIARFHGTDERLSIDNLERGIVFYNTLLSGL